MVERLFIHNYKGFVNFEMKFGRTVLLVGRNGSGKSSLVDVLHDLVMVIFEGSLDAFEADHRNRFAEVPTQRFELDVRLQGQLFRYRLEVGFKGIEQRPFVVSEEFSVNETPVFPPITWLDKPLYDVDNGAPILDPHRGGLAIFFESQPEVFRDWVQGFLMLRLVPSQVKADAKRPGDSLSVDGSDFVAFYDTVSNADTDLLVEYLRAMKSVIPGMRTINLKPLYKSGKLWEAEFQTNGTKAAFTLSELSDGQISLVILYAVLHFCVRQGMTVALDEPDNYLALAEIEPFLHELEDAAENSGGQVFLISHHPEIYNFWARESDRCRYLKRNDDGRFVAQSIDWDEHPGLTPAELVARGWEDA